MMTDPERAHDALNFLDPGCSREVWVRAGMAAKSAGLPFADFHNWSARAENYAGEKDCLAAWKSFSANGGIGAGTLFALAKKEGWQDDRKRTASPRPAPTIAKPAASPAKPVKQVANASAVEVWSRCIPATDAEPYIHRKQGKPDGLRVYPASSPPLVIRGQNVAGYLAAPAWNGNDLQTLQFIPPDGGDKLNLPGASFNDGFFTVGEVAGRAYIVEGIGQAWAVHKATGAAAVCCFGAGRMERVAKVLRAKYPAAGLVICPDRGKEEQAAQIAAAVAGQFVSMPDDAPQNYDCNDFAQEHGTGALAALLERPVAPAMRYALLTDEDLHKLPPMQWRIKKVLPEKGLVAVSGVSGSSKSFVLTDMEQAIAAGRDWFGYKTRQCRIVHCALEGEAGQAGRVAAYRIRHGKTSPNIRYMLQPFSLLEPDDITDLARAIKANGQGAEVIVIDTLNRAACGADENSSADMGRIIAAAKELQELIGGLVIVSHHIGKDASKGLRGHSSLHAALDAVIEVRRDGDRREWLIAKSKDGEDGESHPFKLDIVELGTDEDGEPITSCTLHPLEEIADRIKKVMPPKSGNQRAVWDALGDVFRKAGNARPDGAPDTLPQGRPCITLETAIDKTRARLVCDPKRQTERAQAAIRGLIDRGLLCHERGFLWCQ